MHLITTHLSADFDGLASMIAAQKLFPEAIMAFPGSQERNVKEYLKQHLPAPYQVTRLRDIDLNRIEELTIVDTRIAERLGPLAKCLNNGALILHIFDHHPLNPGDLQGSTEDIRHVGSTTTILVQNLQKQQKNITPDEATLFCLGIYEDTGSLSHLTTTPEDLHTAAYLLEKGAQLDLVTQFISHELTTIQVQFLHDLLKTARRFIIQDIPVVIVTLSIETFVDDFAILAKRFMLMENLDTLFVLAGMAGRIYLIARSRATEVDVGIIAREMGGGGHSTAASATIRNMTIIEAQEKLLHALQRHIRPQSIAKEMMSQPVITAPNDITVMEAHELLTRYNITVLPLIPAPLENAADSATPSLISGMISRREVEKAIHHNFANAPASDFMTSDIQMLSPDATLAEIQELIIEQRQRLIPIIETNRLVGVITRTDLLNRLVNDPANLPQNLLPESDLPLPQRHRSVARIINESLDRKLIEFLHQLGSIADQLSYKLYAVGGFVRDLLLRKRNHDLDVVVEGDGIKLAKTLTEKMGGRVNIHERFATAMVVFPNGFKLDVATARLEYYEYPAALPTIELSSLKLDLYRRDFTINAMAIQLNSAFFGTLIDFFNCQSDLKSRSIKVLHNLSFIEDPTRIFRAIRLEKRMDFTIAKHTERLIHTAVKMKLFDTIEDPRFFNEVKLILSEENPLPAITRLAEFDLFQFLWPDLKPHLNVDRRFNHILTQAHRAISWFKLLYLQESLETWIVYFLAIMSRSGTEEVRSFCKRFALPARITENICRQKEHADKVGSHLQRRQFFSNSEVYWLFEELSNESLLAMMATARKNQIKQYISSYVTTLRRTKPILTGKRLQQLGYRPGPLFRTILNELLSARLDGKLNSEEDELQFIAAQYPLQ